MDDFERPLVEGIPERVSVKWSPEVLNEGFVPFPKRLLRCLGAVVKGPNGINHLRVILAIADYRRPNLARKPSVGLLAFIAGMTTQEFRTALAELELSELLNLGGSDDSLDVSMQPLIARIMQETSS